MMHVSHLWGISLTPTEAEAAAFQTVGDVFRIEAQSTKKKLLWKLRYVISALALFFCVKGVHDIACGWATDERSHWAIPITNSRLLLAFHIACALPFLLACIVQLFLIPWVGESSVVKAESLKRRKYHRIIGRVAICAGVLGAISAAALSIHALEGTWVIFLPWGIWWLLTAVLTWIRARQREWASHRFWAKCLARSGLAFLVGRCSISIFVNFGFDIRPTYYWSMVAAWGITFLVFVLDTQGWHEILRRKSRAKKSKAAFAAVKFLNRLK